MRVIIYAHDSGNCYNNIVIATFKFKQRVRGCVCLHAVSV